MAIYRILPRKLTSIVVRLLKPTFPIGVVAVIFDDNNSVLLLKHTYHAPPWRLPGGIMERHESPQQTAIREAMEEANCVIHPLGVVDATNVGHSFDVAVAARLRQSMTFVPNAEISAHMWAPLNELPPIPAYQQEFIDRASALISE